MYVIMYVCNWKFVQCNLGTSFIFDRSEADVMYVKIDPIHSNLTGSLNSIV